MNESEYDKNSVGLVILSLLSFEFLNGVYGWNVTDGAKVMLIIKFKQGSF